MEATPKLTFISQTLSVAKAAKAYSLESNLPGRDSFDTHSRHVTSNAMSILRTLIIKLMLSLGLHCLYTFFPLLLDLVSDLGIGGYLFVGTIPNLAFLQVTGEDSPAIPRPPTARSPIHRHSKTHRPGRSARRPIPQTGDQLCKK